ncbi:MAG: hypothetical protein L0027_17555 [Candidatus Rokubacteria bacterium]|nr:hypothetical protein [Candidatus Rokubacteria bacterium]
MTIEGVVAYLVAVGVPVWLVVEQVMCWRESWRASRARITAGPEPERATRAAPPVATRISA